MSKTFLDKDNNILATVYETHEIVANPELEGDEPELTGLLIGNNKYKAGAGGTSVPIVDALPEIGNEGDLAVLKNTNDKIVIGETAMYFVKDGDVTNLENIVKNQLNISEEIECRFTSNISNLDNIGTRTITKINSAEDLIGHTTAEIAGAYLSIENFKFENYLLSTFRPPVVPGGDPKYVSDMYLGLVEYEGFFEKSVIVGDKLCLYWRHVEVDGNDIITGLTDWELASERSIIRFENEDEFIDFSDPTNQHIIEENNELYGSGKWVYLGEFSKPVYTDRNYLLYCYDNGQWSVAAPSITANPKSEGDEKILNGLEMEGARYQVGPVLYSTQLLAIEASLNPDKTYFLDTEALVNQITKTVDDLDEIILDTTIEGQDSTMIRVLYGGISAGNTNQEVFTIEVSDLGSSRDFSIEIGSYGSISKVEFFRDSQGSWFPTGYEGELTFRHLIEVLEHISSDGVIDVSIPLGITRVVGGVTNRILVHREKIEEYESFTIPNLIEFMSTVFVLQGGSSSSSS